MTSLWKANIADTAGCYHVMWKSLEWPLVVWQSPRGFVIFMWLRPHGFQLCALSITIIYWKYLQMSEENPYVQYTLHSCTQCIAFWDWLSCVHDSMWCLFSYEPSQADVSVFEALGAAPADEFVHAVRWYKHIISYGADMKRWCNCPTVCCIISIHLCTVPQAVPWHWVLLHTCGWVAE